MLGGYLCSFYRLTNLYQGDICRTTLLKEVPTRVSRRLRRDMALKHVLYINAHQQFATFATRKLRRVDVLEVFFALDFDGNAIVETACRRLLNRTLIVDNLLAHQTPKSEDRRETFANFKLCRNRWTDILLSSVEMQCSDRRIPFFITRSEQVR